MRPPYKLLFLVLLLSYDVVESKRSVRRKKKHANARLKNKTKIYRDYNWAHSQTDVNWRSILSLTKKPTNKVRCTIFCRSGYHLQILPTGLVRGTLDQRSKYIHFEMQSFGPSLVKLKSVATGRYLSMKRDGALRTTKHLRSRETIFQEIHELNAFHSYASHRYFMQNPHDMLVAIKRNGQIKRATKTKPGQTATQFLVIKSK
ncbi:fibroblast growth factor 1 [Nematostella vectensis]|nr:fibroblast growth factor 1 [Nematostella vectensis]ABJ88944.1 fibroblast growth factor a1 [Nematostella vectensis]